MERKIFTAAKEKQCVLLRDMLMDGLDPNSRDEYGETPLTWASQLGHTPIVKDLLAAGADVEKTGTLFNSPPLILAARGGFRGIVALLAVHANLDAQDSRGATALMRAVVRPDNLIKPPRKIQAIVKILLDSGADPDIQDHEGFTALMWAVHWDNPDVIQLLVEHGATLTIENQAGETALTLADSNGDQDLVSLLHRLGA